jgi:hypothetical protein
MLSKINFFRQEKNLTKKNLFGIPTENLRVQGVGHLKKKRKNLIKTYSKTFR